MDHKTKPVQLDLFSKVASEEAKRGDFRSRLYSRINLSLENIIVLAILLSLSILLFFSLGVERGKRQAINNNDPQKNASQKTVIIPQKEGIRDADKLLVKAPVKPASKNSSSDLLTNSAPPVNSDQVKVISIVTETDQNNPNIIKYTIQVATFKKEEFAKQEATRLKDMGYQAIMKKSGQFNSLSVGSFSSKKEAETMLKKLRPKYDDCFIRRL